jgi:hypothetical protein
MPSKNALVMENDMLRKQLAEAKRDGERLDWLNNQVESGVITMGFEIDGGVFLDHASMADMEEYSYREKNTIRDAIDAAIAARQKEGTKNA